MGKVVEQTETETKAGTLTYAEILRELEALGDKVTNADVFGLLSRLPRRPLSFSSADDIRELRGPLPEDDPAFADGRRR